jgi:N-acetyl-gamma-glutamyl-phosphate/LysW-gamma-L-alpha-aminoadipyl-6-phosphate reductase
MPDLYAVSIIGGSGYAGGELLRILLQHPRVCVQQVTSSRYTGLPVTLLHPNLRGLTDLTYARIEDVQRCDCLFLALPHGESMQSMPQWLERADKIIDLGADFRLHDRACWRLWYGKEHQCPELLEEFQYGVPEIYPDRIRSAGLVAGPGCEAIVSILCLYPFIRQGLIRGYRIIIDAKMGSSQVGRMPSAASHHPERAGVVRSYQPSGHRHGAEIEQVMREFSGDKDISVHISATAVEMVRGVLVTIHCIPQDRNLSEKDLWRALRSEYRDRPFVRIVKQKQGLYRYPEPKILQGTNFCEIGFELDKRGDRLVLLGAIDNLVKGTAGNAVQCLNLMLDFPETLGLGFPGLHPV